MLSSFKKTLGKSSLPSFLIDDFVNSVCSWNPYTSPDVKVGYMWHKAHLRLFTQPVVSEYIFIYFWTLLPSDFTSPHRDVYLEGKDDTFSWGYRCIIHMSLHPTHSLFSTCRHAMLLVLPTALWESSNRNLHHSLVLSSAVLICCHYGVAATYITLTAKL